MSEQEVLIKKPRNLDILTQFIANEGRENGLSVTFNVKCLEHKQRILEIMFEADDSLAQDEYSDFKSFEETVMAVVKNPIFYKGFDPGNHVLQVYMNETKRDEQGKIGVHGDGALRRTIDNIDYHYNKSGIGVLYPIPERDPA